MKKILYIVSTLRRTGPINVLYNFLKYIDREKFQPIILTLSSEPDNSMLGDFKKLSIEVISLNLSRAEGFIVGGKRLKKITSNIKPDIVHNSGYRPNILTSLFLKDVTKMSTKHNVPFEDYPMTYGKIVGGIMSCTELRALKKMNSVVACSYAVKDKIRNKAGLDIEVVYNGVDTEKFYPISYSEKLELRKKLDLGEKSKIFIYGGNITKLKNSIFLVEGFKKAFPKEEAVLLMVGTGEMLEECIKAASGYNNIKFIGYVKNPKEYFQASDFYISASLSEGLPTSVMEAMAVGLPVILSNIEPHKELVSLNKEIGLLFNAENIEDLASQLKEIIIKDYNKLSLASIQTVEDRLTAKHMAESYEKFYGKLLSKVR